MANKNPNKDTRFGGAREPRRGKSPGPPPGYSYPQFLRAMQHRAMKTETLRRLDEALASADNPEFLKAYFGVADRAFGTPKQSVDVTSDGKGLSALLAMPPEQDPK
jgi:hypothetical protein